MLRKHNKLVRDKIPEICIQDGEIPKVKILSDAVYKSELKKKLIEESQELVNAKPRELKNEIVDVYEVLLNISKNFGIKWSEIEKLRKDKNKRRGSFKKKIFLISSKK